MLYPEYNKLANRFCVEISNIIASLTHETEGGQIDYLRAFHYIHMVKHFASNYLTELENLKYKQDRP